MSLSDKGFEAANNSHGRIVVRASSMGGGRSRKSVQQQVIEKIYRTIYLNTRSKIGPVEMMKQFPLTEKYLADWINIPFAERGIDVHVK